jgi:hypothetical protein
MQTRTAIAFAAIGSGLPSTVSTIARGGELLESTRAAGTLLVGESAAAPTRLVAGGIAHTAISAFWGVVVWRALPDRHTVAWGGAAGLGIAALDLGLLARRFPAIRRLPRGPQVADHLAFGVVIGWCKARSGRRTG